MEMLKRPWQGTTLAVFDIIGVIFSFLGGLAFVFLQQAIPNLLKIWDSDAFREQLNQQLSAEGVKVEDVDLDKINTITQGLTGILSGFGLVFAIILIGVGVFMIFKARGSLKGSKWSPIVTIIFSGLGLIGSLTTISKGGNGIVGILLNGFFVYCAIMCLRSPYFDKTKRMASVNEQKTTTKT